MVALQPLQLPGFGKLPVGHANAFKGTGLDKRLRRFGNQPRTVAGEGRRTGHSHAAAHAVAEDNEIANAKIRAQRREPLLRLALDKARRNLPGWASERPKPRRS